MRALVFAITTLLNASVFHALAVPGEAQLNQDCARLTKLLPEQLQDLPIRSCERPEHVQVQLSVQLDVPAARVRETERVLATETGMKPLRFVCCGYEAQPITIQVPSDHPLKQGVPKGAFRDVSLSFNAPAFADAGTDNGPLELGKLDGALVLELIDY